MSLTPVEESGLKTVVPLPSPFPLLGNQILKFPNKKYTFIGIRHGFLLLNFFFLFIFNNWASAQKKQEFSWKNLPKAKLPTFKPDTLNIRDFGAIPDGKTINSQFINNAIARCSAKGGGVVIIPEGFWLTGPLVMKSNVNLHISKNAILQFSADFSLYALVKGSYEGKESMRNQSPISGRDLEKVAITGQGIVDGNGDFWRMVTKDMLTEREWKNKTATGGLLSADGKTWYPSERSQKGSNTPDPGAVIDGRTNEYFQSVKDYLRPNMVLFTNCREVFLEGVTFQNSPAWNLHLLMCEDLTLKNLFVKNPDYAQNGDGVDVESSKNVLIDGCIFDVGDDGICIKSGKDEEGRKRGMPTENVVISNNVVYKGHGGFVIGSEMSGGARNIFVQNCSFIGTDKGLRFKTTRGRGGVVEHVYIRNILMKDIAQEAIYFDMYYFAKLPLPGEKLTIPEVTDGTPQFRNIEISEVTCDGADKGIFMRGLPEMNINNIKIWNAVLKSRVAAEIIEASRIELKNIDFIAKADKPVLYFENSADVVLDQIAFPVSTKHLIQVTGERSAKILMKNSITEGIADKITVSNGATGNAVTVKTQN